MKSGYEQALFQLVSYVSGKKKNDCAVVIPYGDTLDMLRQHIRLLEKQTAVGFDVIIIAKEPPEIKTRLNVLFYRENYLLGSSGGFGIGQVLAYTLGYEYIMTADVDAFPFSRNLVEKLKERAEKEQKLVVPLFVPVEDALLEKLKKEGKASSRKIIERLVRQHVETLNRGRFEYFRSVGGTGGANQYGTVTRKLLEGYGFEYFRLFRGAEDTEYMDRLAMDSMLVVEKGAMTRHKFRLFDYIALLKSRGDKYIYYKKSEVIVDILLAHWAFARGKLRLGIYYVKEAFLAVIKTQLFYPQYPDIIGPVYEALFLDMRGVSVGRENRLATFSPPQKAKKLVVSFGKKNPGGIDFAVRHGVWGKLQILWKLSKILCSDADYICPTSGFAASQARFFPILLMMKPLRYSDGVVYCSGLKKWQILLNAAKALALSPFVLAALAASTIKAGSMDYPVTMQNLDKNILEFLEYAGEYQRKRTRT